MSETETVTLNLDGTFAVNTEKAAAAGDKLDATLSKAAKTARTAAQALEEVRAKIAGFDAGAVKALDEAEKKLAKMKADAIGIVPAVEKANDGFAKWVSGLGAAGIAVGVVKSGVMAVADEMKRSREVMVGFIDDWGTAGGKLAVFASAKRELESGIGGKLGGDYGLTRRNALKMGVDPDESWRISKKLLGDKFTQEEIPGILRIKAGMDLAGQNGDALITELQKLKLEPKIKSADIDRLYKMGVDSKAVYADLAKRIGTDVPTAMAKVKQGTVDTGEAIKSITKVANEKFGGFTDILGNTIPSLLARVKGEMEDLFDGVDPAPVKKILKDVIADLEGPQGARLKGSVQRLFGAVFHTDVGGKLTVDKIFDAAAAGADRATAAVKRLQPTVDHLLATLDRMQKTKGIDNLIKAGEGAAQEKIKEQEDVSRAWVTKGRLATGKSSDIGGQFEWVQKIRRKLREAGLDEGARGIGESDDDRAASNVGTDRVKEAAKQGGKAKSTMDFAEAFSSSPGAATPAADKLPLLLNAAGPAGGGDQRAGAADAGAEMGPGMAEGILAGESEAIQAAADMAEKALQAAKDKLKIKSPSGAFDEEVGGQSAAGMAQGMTKHPGPEAAGKTMAQNALGAAKGAAGGASASAGGGGPVIYQINMGAGTTADDLARLEALLRRVDRARAEGGSLPAYR